jgi:hypothetical protein
MSVILNSGNLGLHTGGAYDVLDPLDPYPIIQQWVFECAP